MCLLTLRSTDNKDGTIQQDDPPTSCKDGRQDFNFQQFSSIEKHEREAATSYIKTPCRIRKKLEAAINLDRSFNADAVWDEDFGELRVTLESADDNLKTQMLQNQTNNLKEDHPKLEMEKGIMCVMTEKQTPYIDGEIEEENMKMEVLNENDWIYSPFTVGKENKSIDIDNKLLSDIDGYTYQQNKTGAIQFQRNPFHFSLKLFAVQYKNYKRISKDLQDKNLTSEERIKIAFKDKNLTSEERIKIAFKDKNLTSEERIKIAFKDKNLTSEERIKIAFKDKNLTSEERIRIVFKDANIISEENIKIIFRHLQGEHYRKTIEKTQEDENKKEKKEYIRQLFLMVLLCIILKNISGNIKCRQTSCRKYPCLNSILYLLWQSGDIEVNPGPANSTTYRYWLHEICSIVRKAIAGVPAECKRCNIWKKKPENWPHGELYFDPRNSKGLNVNKVEYFLQILIRCCDGSSKLSDEITSEIDSWNKNRSKDNEQLLHLYRTRECLKSTEQVDRSLKVLQRHLLPDENLAVEVNPCIRISLSCQPAIHQQFITHTIYRAEATRKIASYLCIILHGKDPEGKCDNIWTKTPDGWPTDCRYYNPNNGGKRCAKNEDAMLVEALITLCKQKSIILPRPYQDMVEAWRADDQTLLSKLLTRHTAETDLKKAVMKLHEEGLLQDPEVDKHLREIGLLVQCDGSTHIVKSQKRKIVNPMNKHETKRSKQGDHEDAVDTTLKELLPGCSIGQLLDIQSDSFLLDTISQNIPDFLGDEADDIQFHWT